MTISQFGQIHFKKVLINFKKSCRIGYVKSSGCSAVGSALGSGPRGRGFESRHSDHKLRIWRNGRRV